MDATEQATDQLFRMAMLGSEYVLRLTGAGSKHLASALWSLSTTQQKSKGKARLTSMLKSGKELKVFSITEGELSTFAKEAKRYGVLYAIVKGKGANPDALVDVMVKTEDASKINRIIERLEYGRFDETDVVVESQRDLDASGKSSVDKDPSQKRTEDLLGEMLGEKTGVGGAPHKNPTEARTESPAPSAPSSKQDGRQRKEAGPVEEAVGRSKTRDGTGFGDERDRPSVKAKIDEKRKARDGVGKSPDRTPTTKQTTHKAPAPTKRKSPKPPTQKGR